MKKSKSVPNRKTFKSKEHKAGTYTIVPYSILNNPKLSPSARLLLIQILSDSDDFTLSPSLYAKRLGVDVKTVYNKLNELAEHGYLNRKPIDDDVIIKGKKKKGSSKKLYHYTISEFGNLNSTDDRVNEEKPKEKKNIKPNKEDVNELIDLVKNDYFTSIAYGQIDEHGIENFDTDIKQFYELVKRISKKKPQVQKEYITEVKEILKDYNSEKYPDSIKKKMHERIKQVVYKENRIFKSSEFKGALNEAQKYWSKLTCDYQKKEYEKNMDYETLMYDKMEQSYYDGDSE